MESWWWLSFIDEISRANIGVCIIRGKNISSAVVAAHSLGINPGGEVLGVKIPDDALDLQLGTNRFISASELFEKGYVRGQQNAD